MNVERNHRCLRMPARIGRRKVLRNPRICPENLDAPDKKSVRLLAGFGGTRRQTIDTQSLSL